MHNLRRAFVLGLAFFASASAVLFVRQHGVAAAPRGSPAPPSLSQVRAGHRREVFFVLLAGSRCHGIRIPGFKEQLARAKELVAKQAAAQGAVFASIGIAIDPISDDGLAMLREFGPFDEVDAGSNWENLGATAFFWRELPGPGSVPQVLIVAREVDDNGSDKIVIGPDKLLVRRVGGNALLAWAKAGAPIT